MEILEQRYVVVPSRTCTQIRKRPWRAAELERARRRKYGCVEPFGQPIVFAAGNFCGLAVIHWTRGAGSGGHGTGDHQRLPGLVGRNAVELPASEHQIERTRALRQVALAAAKG